MRSYNICLSLSAILGFPGGAGGKELACQCRRQKRRGFDSWVGTIPWRRAWQPTPVFLPGNPMDRGACGLWFIVSQSVRHNWSNLACTYLTLPCFTPSKSIYIVPRGTIFPFLCPNNIFFCPYNIYICKIFFVHSSVSGHLGSFRVLAIVMILHWTWEISLRSDLNSLNIYPDMRLLSHMVLLFLIFWGASVLFSIMVVPVCILTHSGQGSCFLTKRVVLLYLFDNSHPNRCEVISHSGFNLHFLDD